jgi:hypothetical protein
MARRDVHLLLGMAALTVALLLVQAATGVEVLMASPFLALALPLLAGRYVGERRIQRLVARFTGKVLRPACARATRWSTGRGLPGRARATGPARCALSA